MYRNDLSKFSQKNLFEEDNSNIKTDVTNQIFIIVKDTAIQNSLSSKTMFIYIFINLKLNFDFIFKKFRCYGCAVF